MDITLSCAVYNQKLSLLCMLRTRQCYTNIVNLQTVNQLCSSHDARHSVSFSSLIVVEGGFGKLVMAIL